MNSSFRDILEVTARYFGISYADIVGDGRQEPLPKARGVAYTLAHVDLKMSASEIARNANCHVSTVQKAIKKCWDIEVLRIIRDLLARRSCVESATPSYAPLSARIVACPHCEKPIQVYWQVIKA